MKYEKLSAQEALTAGLQLPYAMIRSLSQVTLGRMPSQVTEDELLEARFFNSEQEIRVFCGENGLQAVRLSAEPVDRALEETYEIENKQFGGSLTVARVLDWDGDGQAYVTATRLSGWKEENHHG